MTDTKPKRRWFRFSLRTLFVVVTLFGAALAWLLAEKRYISDRQQFLKKLENGWGDVSEMVLSSGAIKKDALPTIPFIREKLGDRAYSFIMLPRNADQPLVDEANRLFPEAVIVGGFEEWIDLKKH